MRETLQCGDIVLDMLRRALPAIEGNDMEPVTDIEKTDDNVDALHEAIKLYLIRASKADMGEDDSRRYVEILTFTTNLEHIGDIIDKNLMELAAKKIKKRYAFSPEGAGRAASASTGTSWTTCAWRSTCSPPATWRWLAACCSRKRTMRSREFEAADRHFARLRQGRAECIETSSIHLDIDPRPEADQLAFDLGCLSDPRGRRRAAREPAARQRRRCARQRCGRCSASWNALGQQRTRMIIR